MSRLKASEPEVVRLWLRLTQGRSRSQDWCRSYRCLSHHTRGSHHHPPARPASLASFSLKSFSNDDSCVFQAGAVCLSEYTIKPGLVPPAAGVVQSWRRAVSISRLRRRNARSLTFQITIPAMPLLAAIVSQQKRISNTTCSVLMFS